MKNLRNQLAQAQAERKFRSVTTLRKFRSVTTFNKSFDQIKRNTKQLLIKNSRKKTWKKTRISADWSSENFQNIDVLYLRYLQGYHHNHQILGLICFLLTPPPPPTENIRNHVFWSFHGRWKGNMGRNWFKWYLYESPKGNLIITVTKKQSYWKATREHLIKMIKCQQDLYFRVSCKMLALINWMVLDNSSFIIEILCEQQIVLFVNTIAFSVVLFSSEWLLTNIH